MIKRVIGAAIPAAADGLLHSIRYTGVERREIENLAEWRAARGRRDDGRTVVRFRSGPALTIRHNVWDHRIVEEIFFDQPYLRGVRLPAAPMVLDVGGYIGDFTLFMAVRHSARVLVYEPTAENRVVLDENVRRNGVGERVKIFPKALSGTRTVTLNVEVVGQEVHASSGWYPNAERREIASDTLDDVFAAHGVEQFDLVKLDCEGGEYGILEAASADALARVSNLVFEYHRTPGYKQGLNSSIKKLVAAGFNISRRGMIVTATRQAPGSA